VLSLGADTERFSPARRDPDYRRKLGLPGDGPLLIYAGRWTMKSAPTGWSKCSAACRARWAPPW
jgi:hypothetical protein